jgi:hypothetical protein
MEVRPIETSGINHPDAQRDKAENLKPGAKKCYELPLWSGENRVSVPPMETGHEIDAEKPRSEFYQTNTVINTFPPLLYSEKQLRFIESVVYVSR